MVLLVLSLQSKMSMPWGLQNLNAAQLPGWISPLVKRKNWWSCLLIWRTRESRARSASTISSIIHHYGTFDYHCCKAHCVLTVPILSGNLQAHCITATNSCVPCCSDNSILCARQASHVGGKTLHCIGFPCAFNSLGNTRHAPARCGKEDLHFTWEISPTQCNTNPMAKSWGEGSCVADGYTGLKRSIPAVLEMTWISTGKPFSSYDHSNNLYSFHPYFTL